MYSSLMFLMSGCSDTYFQLGRYFVSTTMMKRKKSYACWEGVFPLIVIGMLSLNILLFLIYR